MKTMMLLTLGWMCCCFAAAVPADDQLGELNPRTVGLWEEAAEAGSVKAAVSLSHMYDWGLFGQPRNPAKALTYLEMAAEHGDAQSMSQLGKCYMTARGGARDYKRAAEWFRRAGEAGDDLGWARLAELYEKGWGVPQDYAEMRRLCELGARKNLVIAYGGLARIYDYGLGVETNAAEAVKWYKKCIVAMNADHTCYTQAWARLNVLAPMKFQIDYGKIDGDGLMDEIQSASADPRVLHVVAGRLNRRELVMTGLQVVHDDHRWKMSQGRSDHWTFQILAKVKAGEEGKRQSTSGPGPFLLVRFPKGMVEGVEAEPGDRFDSLTLRIECLGTSANSLQCIASACTLAKAQLPDFDAVTITGTEVSALFDNVKIRASQRRELQRRLAGRKLSFGPVSITGTAPAPNSKGRLWSFLVNRGSSGSGMGVEFHCVCSDEKTNRLLRNAMNREGMEVIGVTATVAGVDGGMVKNPILFGSRAWLELADAKFQIAGKMAEMPEVDFPKMSGEEVGRTLSKLRGGVSSEMLSGLLERIGERELVFPELFVVATNAVTTNGTFEVLCSTARVKDSVDGLQVALELPASMVAKMPHAPAAGDSLVGVAGRVMMPPPDEHGPNAFDDNILRLCPVSAGKLKVRSSNWFKRIFE